MRVLLESALAEVPAVLHGDDARAVHDMRVAIRRLRSAQEAFGSRLPGRAMRRFARAAKRLGRRLGVVRDADVALAALRGALGGATTAEQPGIAYAIDTIAVRRRWALAAFAIELSQFDRAAFGRLLGG